MSMSFLARVQAVLHGELYKNPFSFRLPKCREALGEEKILVFKLILAYQIVAPLFAFISVCLLNNPYIVVKALGSVCSLVSSIYTVYFKEVTYGQPKIELRMLWFNFLIITPITFTGLSGNMTALLVTTSDAWLIFAILDVLICSIGFYATTLKNIFELLYRTGMYCYKRRDALLKRETPNVSEKASTETPSTSTSTTPTESPLADAL